MDLNIRQLGEAFVQIVVFFTDLQYLHIGRLLPDSALALLDYVKIGREHREQTGGVYTGFGYVERQSEIRSSKPYPVMTA